MGAAVALTVPAGAWSQSGIDPHRSRLLVRSIRRRDFTFGDAPFYGSLGGQGIENVIGMADTSPLLDPYRAVHARSGAAGTPLSLHTSP